MHYFIPLHVAMARPMRYKHTHIMYSFSQALSNILYISYLALRGVVVSRGPGCAEYQQILGA